MLGDKVLVLVDVGNGATREEAVSATRAGGSVDVRVGDAWAIVEESSQSGAVVRSVRVPVDRVVAVIEEPRRRG